MPGQVSEIGDTVRAAFDQMYCGIRSPFNPQGLLASIWRSAETLAGYAQQDAHEFFIAAINGMHAATTGNTSTSTPDGQQSSMVHRVFGGKLQSDVICCECDHISTRVDPIYDISLDVRQPSDHGEVSAPGASPTTQSLGLALDRYTAPERLVHDERPFCTRCQKHSEALKQCSFAKLPPVVCFHLKRFQQTSTTILKIDHPVSFPLSDLDLAAHTSASVTAKRNGSVQSDSESGESTLYDLFAIVEHIGTMDSGHYIAWVRSREDWVRCDDAMIAAATDSEVLASKGYMLFYAQHGMHAIIDGNE